MENPRILPGRGLRCKKRENGGLFNKITPEGVSGALGRPIRNQRPGLEEGKGKEEAGGRNRGDAAAPHGRRRAARWRRSPGRYGPRFPDPRAPRERGGRGELDSTLCAAGRGSRTTARGGAIADPPEHTVTVLRRIKTRGENCGRERGRLRAHRRGRRGRGRPSFTGTPRSGSRRLRRLFSTLAAVETEARRGGNGEGEVLGRVALPTSIRARGRGEKIVGERGALRFKTEREREVESGAGGWGRRS